jgi:tRNA pseudouridine synthase 10
MVPTPPTAEDLLLAAKETSLAGAHQGKPLCDSCLGRLFAKVGTGTTTAKRGQILREGLGAERPEECWICRGLMEDIPQWARLAEAALREWEFDTFLVGSRFDDAVLAREEEYWASAGVTTQELIKAEVNREVGKRLEASLAREVDFDSPDVVVIVETAYDHVEVRVSPLFIRGRYRKLVREIPQTKWPCRNCRGAGCERCGHTGKMYPESVEEIIAAPLMEMTGGTAHTFHGMGREDLDALMLGNGRPFVLEISEPRRRSVDLEAAARKVNASGKVEALGLEFTHRKEVQRIKAARFPKTYSVSVAFPVPVDERKLKEAVSSFEGVEIRQRTPTRVTHRRADRTRLRTIRAAKVVDSAPTRATLEFTADAGTYIKELLHGDAGRTKPSLADELGVDVQVKELDVIRIHDGDA